MKVLKGAEKQYIPNYRMVIQSIEQSIMSGQLKVGDKLPSLNNIKEQFQLSRDTVLIAFSELKQRGIVYAVAGKGYYVKSTSINVKQKIFLLFDELNAFKQDLYNSFLSHINPDAQVDIFFHHFNVELFAKLISDHAGNYTHYVIMPANLKNTAKILSHLNNQKVVILDQLPEDLMNFPAVYQNFEKGIYESLIQTKTLVEKYQKIILLFPKSKQPYGMLSGFQKFKKQINLQTEVIANLDDNLPAKGSVYVLLDDEDLIKLVKIIKKTNLKIGQDIGIISYNDTMLKEIIADGITTISTDFYLMGKNLAKIIAEDYQGQIENPNRLIMRHSL